MLFQGCSFLYIGRVPYDQKSFEQIRPQARFRILFLGDSTAVGTGSGDGRTSVAGWFAQDFPAAHIINRAQNGYRLKDILKQLEKEQFDHYNLVVIQAGANDILRFTSLRSIQCSLEEIIKRAEKIGDDVVVLHSGDIGTAPIFWWPLKWFYSLKTKAVRKIYLEAEKNTEIHYVDLYGTKVDEIFLDNKKKYYSDDYLHLTGEGYRAWYQAIRDELKEAGALEN